MPLCLGLEHKMIVARSACPLGLVVKIGELTKSSSPAGRLPSVADALQPIRFVKSSAYRERTVLLTVSLIVKAIELKDILPWFSNSKSTHQPVPVQLSRLKKAASKLGFGVGVNVGVGLGGGVKIGSTPVFPVTVAYSPHNQQVSLARSGLR